jgi:hypothetical protein
MKRALVIGIDDYPTAPLHGCVNDAIEIGTLLQRNGDGSPNFAVRTLTSNDDAVTSVRLHDALDELFGADAETALFFFAGHGVLNTDQNTGHVVAQDGKRGAWGLSLEAVLAKANRAYPKIKSTVILLDCCHAGALGEAAALASGEGVSVIGPGVTIMTACHRNQTAQEFGGHGLFTGILIDALHGSATDIIGRITPAAVYSHVDQILGPWDQRPIYKANVQSFVSLRSVAPKVSLDTLRALPAYFPEPEAIYPLDPTCEPDRKNVPEEFRHLPVDAAKVRVFKSLQQCNRVGLVVPDVVEHMYDAAIQSTGCRLTALGVHYRALAVAGRI